MHKCNAKVSSVGVKQKTLIFDPTSECVFAVQQKSVFVYNDGKAFFL